MKGSKLPHYLRSNRDLWRERLMAALAGFIAFGVFFLLVYPSGGPDRTMSDDPYADQFPSSFQEWLTDHPGQVALVLFIFVVILGGVLAWAQMKGG